MVALCGHGTVGCHGWVEHNPDEAAEFGWHVRPWETPADVPVYWRSSDWVKLDVNGGIERVQCPDQLQVWRENGGQS